MNKASNQLILNVLLGVTLIGGMALTAWGLGHLTWPQALPWAGAGALFQYLSFVCVCGVLVVAGATWSKRDPLVVGVVIAVALALFAGAFWPLISVLWFALASAVLGRAVSEAMDIKVKSENWLTHMLVGAGIYGSGVGLLAHFPVNYPGVYGALLTLPLLIWWRSTIDCINCCMRRLRMNSSDSVRLDWLNSAIAVVALIHFIVALMPELGHDALAMHLFIPSHMATRHHWGFDADTYVWAVMPMLGDWIFSVGFMLAGETAVRLINVGFIFLLGWLVRDLVSWAGGSAKGAKWAVLIFLSTPLTFTESSSLFIESVWAAYIVSGTLHLSQLGDEKTESKSNLLLAGLLLGFAAAAKAVTLTILPVLALVVLWHFKSCLKMIKPSTWLATGIVFSLVSSIPYITAWQLTGNPVFPFYNGIFKSPYYPPANFDSASIFGKGLTWDLLYRATFNSGKYLEAGVGAPGFQWLLLFVPASFIIMVTKQRRGLVLLLVGILIVAAVFQSVSYLRYVFPAWAILAAIIGLALGDESHKIGPVKVALVGSAIGAIVLNLLFLGAGAFHRDFPLRSILDVTHREGYLHNRLPIRNAVELINRLNVGKTPVAVFAQPMSAGLEADALYSSWYNFRFQSEVNSAHTVEMFSKVLAKRGVDFVILDSAWSGAGEKRDLIEKASELIADYGTISVRKLNSSYRFQTELLKNPEFSSSEGWSFSTGSTYDPIEKNVTVTVVEPVSQAIVVSPGQRYLNSVVSRCFNGPTLGRVQINWMDEKSQFIKADIKTFECKKDWFENTMEVTAPPTASAAIVYSTSHTEKQIQIKRNSVRQ